MGPYVNDHTPIFCIFCCDWLEIDQLLISAVNVKIHQARKRGQISLLAVYIQPKIADLSALKNLHLAVLQISNTTELFIAQSLTPEHDKL